VRVASGTGAVVGWSNPAGTLAVTLVPGVESTGHARVAVEAPFDDVIRLWGTPTAYLADRLRGTVLARYGRTLVTLDAASRRVLALDDAQAGAVESPPQPTRAAEGRGPTLPVTLTARASLVSTGRDGRIDADADVALDVTVRNAGPGVARGMRLHATARGAVIGLPEAWPTLDSLAVGMSRTLRLTLPVEQAARDTMLDLTIAVEEANSFDLDPPLQLRVPLRASRAPRLVLADLAVDDPSGDRRIAPREVVDIVARVANVGEGSARDVQVRIVPGAGVHLTPDAPAEQMLGTLAPSASRDVRFSAFSDSRATGFPVTLRLRAARARGDTSLVLPLALNRPVAATAQLLPPGEEAPSAAPSSLVARVDTGVPRAAVRPGTLAVVLGVERYARAPDAQFAQRDAQTFRQYAQALFGTGDDAGRLFFATNEEVSRSTMHKLFDADGWLARRTDDATDVVVFVAAHGTVDARTRAAYLLPSDADPAYPVQTGMSLDTLFERLGALPARSVTVFLDACFSGTTRAGAALVPWSRDVGVSIEHPALKYPHLTVLTASASGETAMAWGAQRHGLFTYWLLDGLRGAADANRDRVVTAGELGGFVSRRVQDTAAQLGREQSPRLLTRDPGALMVRLP
jgi:hypothetical protein